MKKITLLFLSIFLIFSELFSQGFSGINAGNYAGITGVMLQPASIVDSRFKFDINVFSADARYSNNYLLLDRNVLLKLNKNNFEDYPTFRSKYLSKATLAPGEKTFFNISNRTQLPLSFMVTLNEKSAFSVNLQSRTMIQGRNISQDFANLAFNSFSPQPNNPSIDASGITLRSLSWVEAGLTYGRVLVNSNNHFLKGAITGKYLGGVSSFLLSSNNLRLQVNNDSTFNFSSDRVNYDHNRNVDLNRVIDSRFRPDANTVGFDAGLVYEYRGKLNNVKYIRNDDETSYEVKRRDLNKYIFKLGVSVLDAGMFRFTKENNVNSFAANINNWDIRNANYTSISEFDTALANRVTALPNDPREYNMYLPGALSVQMDVRFVKGLYLNAVAYRPLRMGSQDGSRFNNYGYYSITPRYERRHFGIYIPYTFSDRESITNYRDNWLGLTLRAGPVFLGSSNLGSMAFNKDLKAADFFVGLKIGFTYGKPSKISRLLANKNETDYEMLLLEKENMARERNLQMKNASEPADTLAANRIVVDYSKGQIYNDGKTSQIIVVNNHYYYGNIGANAMDSINNINSIPSVVRRDTLRNDSIVSFNLIQKRKTDSLNVILKDSLMQKREQLDSLIDNLRNLRQRLDSTSSEANLSGYNEQLGGNEGILSDSTADKTTMPQNTKQADSLDRSFPEEKVVDKKETENKETAKKKVTASPLERDQRNTAIADSQRRANVAPVYVGAALRPQQQTIYVEDYKGYMQLSKRLQDDIERLEKQIANNRSAANNAAQQRNLATPVYYNNPATPTIFYPAYVPDKRPSMKDTIFVRDSFYVTKIDTIIQIVQSTATTNTISREKIIEDKIDYKKLPPENILFAVGQSTIRQVYVDKLEYLANILLKNPALTIVITGHTDKTGSIAINEMLSLKRAQAVKSFFLQKGIDVNRIQVNAVASEDPLVAGNTNNANMQNRRVEIKML